MTDMLDTYLGGHPNEALKLTQQLCALPSIAAQGIGLEATADAIESLLTTSGFATQQLVVEGAPPAVYAEMRGRGPFTILLYNHYDVQPPDPLELWTTPPFEPTEREGKLYARGASDNKGEIAARLAAVRALRAVDCGLPITVRWIIEGEEEVGSPHFAALAERHAGLLSADGCLWEGGGFDAADRPEITLGTKGLLYVQLEVEGMQRDAHSGAAPILPSAAWRLVHALACLRSDDGTVRIPGFYDAVRAPTADQLEGLADQTDMEDEMRQAFGVDAFADGLTGVPLRERHAFSPTGNIAGLASGYAGEGVKTILPARAMAKMDFRLVPDQDPDDVFVKLQAHLVGEGFADVEVIKLGAAEPVVTPIEHPFVQRVIKVSERFAGKPPSIHPIVGGTLPLLGALRQFVGVPGLSPPGNPSYWASAAHAPDEHIRLDDLRRAVRYNCALFRALA